MLQKSSELYRLKPLAKKVPTCKPDFPTLQANFPVVLVRDINDIETLEDRCYGFPLFSNFLPVDAIIQPETLIQFTIAQVKDNGATGKLPEIRKKLRGPLHDHRIIFIVPTDNFESFKYVPERSGIQQYVCFCNPAVSDNVLMTRASRKDKGCVR